MRINYQGFKRAYVYDWRLGGTRFARVMKGRTQIWPDNEERVERAVLEAEGFMPGELNYFFSALSAFGQDGLEGCRGVLKAGGLEFAFMRPQQGMDVVRYDYDVGSVLSFDGRGPVRGDLCVGDTVELAVEVPRRETAEIGGEEWWDYRFLYSENLEGGNYKEAAVPPVYDGVEAYVHLSKWQKKVGTGTYFQLLDDDGDVWYWGYYDTFGRFRDTIDRLVYTLADVHRVSRTPVLRVVPDAPRGPWWGKLVYPAFSRTFRLKVTELVHSNEV